MDRFRVLLVVTHVFSCALVAAGATTFNNQAAFLAAVNPSHFESFESFAPLDTDLPVLNLAEFSITDLNAISDELIVEDTNFDVHATHGTNYVYWFVFSAGGGLRFDFNRPINAFGFTLTDAVDQGVDTISYSTDGGDAGTVVVGTLPNANELFWGIQSDAPMTFAELTFTHTSTFDAVGIDEVYFNIVPEPACGMLLLLSGAAGWPLLRARRQRDGA